MVRSGVQACDLSMRSTPFWIVPLSSAPLIVSWPLATSEKAKKAPSEDRPRKAGRSKPTIVPPPRHGGHGPLGGGQHGVPVEAGPLGGQ